MAGNNEIETLQESPSKIADLREAMTDKRYRLVRRLCREVPEGPLERISIYDDTVLHIAAHSKQKDLVLDLLKMIPEDRNHQLSNIKNSDGNTILHELATTNASTDAGAAELLTRAPKLLTETNKLGEGPIFCAARHGQIEMFKFLVLELKKLSKDDSEAHLRRYDGKTVLHVSIITECFDLALFIVKSYPNLIKERDRSWMTALQYLACNPTAFRKGEVQIRQGFMELVNKSKIKVQERTLAQRFKIICELLFKEMESNDRYKLRELVRHLVEKDTSWDANINSQAMKLGESDNEPKIGECSSKLPQKNKGQNSQESSIDKDKKSDESALFLATMSNIQEIVKEVLNFKPQALKHANKKGMNILHVAILYRHIDIFDMVIKHEVFSRRLLSATDDEGNSVLHMVSKKKKKSSK